MTETGLVCSQPRRGRRRMRVFPVAHIDVPAAVAFVPVQKDVYIFHPPSICSCSYGVQVQNSANTACVVSANWSFN